MRILQVKQSGSKKKQEGVAQFNLGFVGTAWCIVPDRLLVTAHHILNEGNPRDPNDRFYVYSVPGNGRQCYRFPVANFPLEDPALDIAVLEVGPPDKPGQHIPAMPVTFNHPDDGTRVLTYGFPAPKIIGGRVDSTGRFLGGGQFFLKGHANEGIVAAQYDLAGVWFYDFNVGWHHGESGGPVIALDPVAAFCVIQHYRTVQAPDGPYPGPRQGRSLECVRQQLTAMGANVL